MFELFLLFAKNAMQKNANAKKGLIQFSEGWSFKRGENRLNKKQPVKGHETR